MLMRGGNGQMRSIMIRLSVELQLGQVRRRLAWHQGVKVGQGKGPSMVSSAKSVVMDAFTFRGWLIAEG